MFKEYCTDTWFSCFFLSFSLHTFLYPIFCISHTSYLGVSRPSCGSLHFVCFLYCLLHVGNDGLVGGFFVFLFSFIDRHCLVVRTRNRDWV